MRAYLRSRVFALAPRPSRYEHAAVPVRFSSALLEGGIGDRKGLFWERSEGMQGGRDLYGAIRAL